MTIKTEEQKDRLIRSGKILRALLEAVRKEIRPGVSLKYLDDIAYEVIKKSGGKPAFLGYKPAGAKHPYPATICSSVNDVVVHGQPNSYQIKDGDLVKIDAGVVYDGLYTDAAFTVGVGKISPKAEKLIEVTEKALYAGIEAAAPGNTLGDIGYAIEKVVKSAGFKVMDGLTGHGTGLKLHENPTIYNFGNPGEGQVLKEGMVLALEPMAAIGTSQVKQLKDESYATVDGSLSAHFEHTVLITKSGAEILTD